LETFMILFIFLIISPKLKKISKFEILHKLWQVVTRLWIQSTNQVGTSREICLEASLRMMKTFFTILIGCPKNGHNRLFQTFFLEKKQKKSVRYFYCINFNYETGTLVPDQFSTSAQLAGTTVSQEGKEEVFTSSN